MRYEGSMLEGPYTKRPDLSWAMWQDLWYALYIKPYPQADFSFVTKRTRNPAWDKWWEDAANRLVNPPPSPTFIREEIEVELHWVRVELDERREKNLQRALGEIRNAATRELLGWLKSARACGGWWSPCDKNSEYGYRFDDIKAELDTREHIPNKQEARALRRGAALQHRKNKLRGPVAQG